MRSYYNLYSPDITRVIKSREMELVGWDGIGGMGWN
jgi:hypothetical protein